MRHPLGLRVAIRAWCLMPNHGHPRVSLRSTHATGFADLLAGGADEEGLARLRAAESIGRPLGDERFPAGIERLTTQTLRAGKRGPKSK